MTTPLKSILIIGATGSVGRPILSALLAEPSFTVTILTRASSSAKFPAGVPVKTISDAYTTAELTTAFTGHDAVVSAISTGPVTKDDLAFRIIDACLAAGVRRLIPSEFGANNLDPRATSLVPVYALKGKMLKYLIERAAASKGKLTWTSISCGSWLDWGLNPAASGNFLGIDVKRRKATIWDSGRARFSVTTSGNTGFAVARALLHPELSENKQIFLSDFVTTPREILESLERQTGEKWAVEEKQSAPRIRELKAQFDAGDFNATFGLLALSFVGDVEVGYDFEKEGKVWNGELGLPVQRLDEVVKGAIELAKAAE
ncbi:isoflavone reductase family protein [Bimuria novae-zelandiae CBS 107.79]|uniref:Isoflavone reductase family protein n=1 Tax=Bimuria novae-zelandiae CBS 107.79 TaxID=1447943 RepID=A0A6A5VHQ7_9PLEO|nr:isoflavone reductase family protein [Bimuria novae-zelandiae CBS 107.79]